MSEAPVISARTVLTEHAAALVAAGVHPLLARIYAPRGISSAEQLATAVAGLLGPARLHNVERMAGLLADAIAAKQRLLIIADYDSDGATACAVGIRALRAFGATVDYLVPNRFDYGYGLTPEIVIVAKELKNPDILITVDNGIASIEGVAMANQLGMRVLITDHHLPGAHLPDAWCIINPNQPDCSFPSKNLAGVGVMFYLMLALRAELRRRGAFLAAAADSPSLPGQEPHGSDGSTTLSTPLGKTVRDEGRDGMAGSEDTTRRLPAATSFPEAERSLGPPPRSLRQQPNLGALLDLVALGTVADVVRLDDNNRILIQQGLQRIRSGKTWPGIAALVRVAGRDPKRISTYDLGFVLGPRLNAAGRLSDMSVGIECLISDDHAVAERLARELDALNRERRSIEAGMHDNAIASMDHISPQDSFSLCLFDTGWHQGVIGILASRLKERWNRPVIAFARGINGEIRGSGRSIASLHLRDALDLVAKREPGLLTRFGGHAAAAGLTISEGDFARFSAAFEATVRSLLSPADLQRVIETDGVLPAADLTLESARLIEEQVWGQGFPQPTFEDEFDVTQQSVVGERHLKVRLAKHGHEYEAMVFSHATVLPQRVRAIYRLAINEYNGMQKLQLTIEHWLPA